MAQYLTSITLVNGDVTGGIFQAIAAADISGTMTVSQGGTGDTSFTAYAVVCGGTTSTGALQNVSGVGSSGQVLTSTGAGSLPTWQTPAGGNPFSDASALVKNAADATKLAILSAASITTATTRTYTLPDANVTLAGLSNNQTFTGNETFSTGTITFNTSPTSNFGSGTHSERWGNGAGASGATGDFYSCFGYHAGASLAGGSNNTLLGYNAGGSVDSASYQTYVGFAAGSGGSGANGANTGVGANALINCTGQFNTMVGSYYTAGNVLTTGNNNTLMGAFADTNASGTVAGVAVGYNSVTDTRCVAIGNLASATGTNAIAIGSNCINSTNNTVAFNATDSTAATTTTLTIQGNSSTTLRSVARFNTLWATSTDASRAARYYVEVFDTAGRATIGADTDGTGANVNFFAGSGGGSYGSGRNVIFLQNAAVNPSTNPTGGGILYSNGGAGTWRGSGGTVTAFGPAGPHCGQCGYDHWRVACRNDIWGSHLYECGMCGKTYKKGPQSVLDRLSPEQMAEIITE